MHCAMGCGRTGSMLACFGVHCAMRCGRTGAMLACYLVAKESYSADKAIEETRRRRHNSIKTRKQEQAVRMFEESLRK